MTKTLSEHIGIIAGVAVSQLPDEVKTSAENIAVSVESNIVQPKTINDAIVSTGEILKIATPGKTHVHKIIDAAIDLSIHEEGESGFEDAGTLISVIDDAVKAWKEKRKDERKGE